MICGVVYSIPNVSSLMKDHNHPNQNLESFVLVQKLGKAPHALGCTPGAHQDA